jgi:uncharacterized protein YjiK
VKLTLGQSYRIDVKEPSGLAFLSAERGFITVDDESSTIVRLVVPADPEGQVRAEEIDVGEHRHLLRGLEGVAFDREAGTLLVISENSRTLSELALETGRGKLRLGDPIKRKTLDKIGDDKAHGWEGIVLLPARLTPDGHTRLLAVHERKPRGIAVLDRATLAMESFVPLPKDIAHEADDLSDLTVDPRSGHLFLLSDESAAVLETVFEGTAPSRGAGASAAVTWSLRLVGRTELPHNEKKHRLQPEGLAFDDAGDLWVVSEGDRSIRRLIRD